jgi:uncharacterized protein with gpF-like domain
MPILIDAFSLTPAQAVAFLRGKGMRITNRWTDLWRDAHTQSFTVANLLRMDLLQSVRDMIDGAVKGDWTTDTSGSRVKRSTSFNDFKNDLIPRMKKAGWWGIEETVDKATGEIIERQLGSVHRLRTIYDTNVQQALHAGRYKQQVAVKADLPYWQYRLGSAIQHTEQCANLKNKIFRADDPVWSVIYPRNHWGCHGSVVALTERQAGRRSADIVEESEIVSRKEPVGAGDEKRVVDVRGVRWGDGENETYWCGAGWDYNPGQTSFKPDLSKYDSDIANLWEGK